MNFCLQIGRKMSKLKRHRRKQVLNDPTLSRPDPPPHGTDLPIEKTSPPTKNLSSPLVSAKTLMDLYVCKQDQGESVRAFFARVNQIASRVPLSKVCDCGCNNLVSYAAETVFYLVLCGLSDKNMQAAYFLEAEKGGILNESSRLGICRDRRSCKIFVSCVNFPENNAVSDIFCKFIHIHKHIYT